MWWIIFAFIPLIIDSFSNLFDSYFVNKGFKDPIIFMFYLSIFEIIFLPIIFIYELPLLISLKVFGLFAIVAFLDLFYILFYLKALQKDDTSIVVSLFSLGKVAVPVLAFFLLGEKLSLIQYIGFFVIISCASILTYQPKEKIKFNKAALLMIVSSLVGSLEGVIFKGILEQVNWVTGYTYISVLNFASIFLFVFIFERKSVKIHFNLFKKHFKTFGGMSFLNFISGIAGVIAISLASITLVKGIWAIQPIFVLGISILISKYYPKFLKEKIDKKSLVKKLILFIIIITALILTLK